MKKIPVRHIAGNEDKLHSTGKFTIRKVADLFNGNDLLHELHRHDFFFILILHNGAGVHEIDFVPYNILDNTIFFVRPGQVHQLELKAGCTGYLVEFNDEFYHSKEQTHFKKSMSAFYLYVLLFHGILLHLRVW